MNIWIIMIAVGLATYSMRLAFIQAYGRRRIPEWMRRSLRYVPPAVLTAIIFPELLMHNGGLEYLGRQLPPGCGDDRRAGGVAHEERHADRGGGDGGIMGTAAHLLKLPRGQDLQATRQAFAARMKGSPVSLSSSNTPSTTSGSRLANSCR